MVFQALGPYAEGFAIASAPFLHYYARNQVGMLEKTASYTRGEFWDLAIRATHFLSKGSFGWGDAQVHAFTANHPLDLVWRLAATFLGTVPVTLNWQADSVETILYKIKLTGAKLVVRQQGFSLDNDTIASRFPSLQQVSADQPMHETSGGVNPFGTGSRIDDNDAKIIIFTSGTTGKPKGVRHSYRGYHTNAATFDQFIGVEAKENVSVLVVNPLHHANATALTDWCMRRPGAEIHLVESYTTDFWRVLAEVSRLPHDRLVVPMVSRHFDFLEKKCGENPSFWDRDAFLGNAHKVDFLLGSAPVGPQTVERVKKYMGILPRVRFGSTETCLQVLGTPRMTETAMLGAFQRGWDGEKSGVAGYYLGRPHHPHTEGKVVKAIDSENPDFLVACAEGEVGYLITTGNNLMLNYVSNPRETQAVMADGWYLGLKDKVFWLKSELDGEPDYYWVGRDSNLLIRGGANYSNLVLAQELKQFTQQHFQLDPGSFELVVVGVRLDSEHEDSCCVALELLTPEAQAVAESLKANFLAEACKTVSKAAKPQRLMFCSIPKNFKGAIQTNILKTLFHEQE